jgi:hypothetical protein
MVFLGIVLWTSGHSMWLKFTKYDDPINVNASHADLMKFWHKCWGYAFGCNINGWESTMTCTAWASFLTSFASEFVQFQLGVYKFREQGARMMTNPVQLRDKGKVWACTTDPPTLLWVWISFLNRITAKFVWQEKKLLLGRLLASKYHSSQSSPPWWSRLLLKKC